MRIICGIRPVMTALSAHKRFALLLVALLSVIANGAQAHLGIDMPGQIAMPICGMGAETIIVLTDGTPAPVNAESQSCCGDCVSLDAAETPAPNLHAHYAPMIIVYPAQPKISYAPTSPLWPGAPPQGPPQTSDL